MSNAILSLFPTSQIISLSKFPLASPNNLWLLVQPSPGETQARGARKQNWHFTPRYLTLFLLRHRIQLCLLRWRYPTCLLAAVHEGRWAYRYVGKKNKHGPCSSRTLNPRVPASLLFLADLRTIMYVHYLTVLRQMRFMCHLT